jgi:RNA polymerase sigma-70 factor (ECF subfamily)
VGLEFAQVLADNQSMVFSLALRYLRSRETAEELAQDVFLQFYRQIDQIESRAHATWWLRRAICHRSIDEMRKRKFRPRIGLDDIPEPAGCSTEGDPFLQGQIRKLIEALPEKARMVVLLRYQEDLDPTEISEMLEMPISTVKSHLHRSLTALRKELKPADSAVREVCS